MPGGVSAAPAQAAHCRTFPEGGMEMGPAADGLVPVLGLRVDTWLHTQELTQFLRLHQRNVINMFEVRF